MTLDRTLECLTAWLPRQRWFTAGAMPPRLRLLADRMLAQDDENARVRVLVVVDDAPTRPIVYQVPLVERTAAREVSAASVIGARDDGRVLIDGPHDPAYTRALLTELGLQPDDVEAEVLSGEQSNTSIIYRSPSAPPVICKVFRPLNPGLNPDIELQTALADAGSAHVPRVLGRVDGFWRSPTDATVTWEGSVAFAQEFLPDVEDAWRVALRAASTSADFRAEAADLGRATADVHRDLARLFPTAPPDAAARATLAGAWARRLSIAIDEVRELRSIAPAIEAVYTAATAGPWPDLQRVHGDYHLGQVLSSPERGWVVLDFEGEPMRPIAERRAPDLALRDIAGMLRSFDYVAGSLRLDGRGDPEVADAWARAARAAFLTGYGDSSGAQPTGSLLDALELDKAVYETIYEARHRPAWLRIPLSAVERLVAR
ncbi:aminoglycoside phosphotransferase [uncultured Microbacterium sp.]|uniref:maltokinase N-terminal cap-like domain-containing protein n=1 Tax=uncultured Microbacterium sp. TaxID=191216 RepID=UPI00261E6833|nr:aminoglycoside phosphotransferase [uncultured Microbacterium sp.]